MKRKVEFLTLMEKAFELTHRREFLTKAFHQKCPSCRSIQIALYNQEMLATWKCRECGHKFKFEPLKNEQI